MNQGTWPERIGMPVTALLLLGLCLVAGGTAHESVLLTSLGVGLFALAALCLSIILLITYRADAKGRSTR